MTNNFSSLSVSLSVAGEGQSDSSLHSVSYHSFPSGREGVAARRSFLSSLSSGCDEEEELEEENKVKVKTKSWSGGEERSFRIEEECRCEAERIIKIEETKQQADEADYNNNNDDDDDEKSSSAGKPLLWKPSFALISSLLLLLPVAFRLRSWLLKRRCVWNYKFSFNYFFLLLLYSL